MNNTFEGSIDKFLNNVRSLAEAERLIMQSVVAARRRTAKDFHDFMEREGKPVTVKSSDGLDIEAYSVPHNKIGEANKLEGRAKRAMSAQVTIPRSLVISLVSHFDAFMGSLLKNMFDVKQEILNTSDKSLTFSQLLQIGDFDKAKKYIVEKEIESVLRKSHSQHFDYIESRLSIPLRKGLDSWGKFIEVTERRNLFAHNDGIVSSQYLTVCAEHKVAGIEEVEAGSILHVDYQYFKDSYECILEIGIKLGQVLWRKLQPSRTKEIDSHLIAVTFGLLLESEYDVVIKILDFARNELMRHSNQDQRLTVLVNLAQAHKWKGEGGIAQKIIDSVDWTGVSDKFGLAHMVLIDDFKNATHLLKKLIQVEEISKSEVDEWPLFKEFRKTIDFKNLYVEIFGETTEIIEKTPELDGLLGNNDLKRNDTDNETDRE